MNPFPGLSLAQIAERLLQDFDWMSGGALRWMKSECKENEVELNAQNYFNGLHNALERFSYSGVLPASLPNEESGNLRDNME